MLLKSTSQVFAIIKKQQAISKAWISPRCCQLSCVPRGFAAISYWFGGQIWNHFLSNVEKKFQSNSRGQRSVSPVSENKIFISVRVECHMDIALSQ